MINKTRNLLLHIGNSNESIDWIRVQTPAAEKSFFIGSIHENWHFLIGLAFIRKPINQIWVKTFWLLYWCMVSLVACLPFLFHSDSFRKKKLPIFSRRFLKTNATRLKHYQYSGVVQNYHLNFRPECLKVMLPTILQE